MFFAGYALILLAWVIVAVIRGGERNRMYAEIITGVFFISLAAWGVGVFMSPAAAGSWSVFLTTFIAVGFTVALLLAAGVQENKDRREHRSFTGGTSGEVRQDTFVSTFTILSTVTVLLALLARFLMIR